MKMTKRIISALILALIALSLVACGGSGEKVLNGTVDELKTALSAANAEGDLMPYDADRLADDIVIKSADYQEGFFLTPINSAGVETIAFFVCADSTAASNVKLRLETYVTDTRNQQKDYNADNYQVALDATVVQEGKYVYLVMSPNKDALLKVIGEKLK